MPGPVTNKTSTGLTDSLDYRFRDADLLETALTHRSADRRNNERLEYLGDAILDFVIAEALYLRFPDAAEGALTRMRASMVKRETLAGVARELHIGDWIRLGSGEKRSGGWRRDSILANTLEALIGAIYLDGGMEQCRGVVLRMFRDLLDGISPGDPGKDPKTTLQEFLQANRQPLPDYRVVAEKGEAHARIFRVECAVAGLAAPVAAEGRSRRNAEQAAAQAALDLLHAGTS